MFSYSHHPLEISFSIGPVNASDADAGVVGNARLVPIPTIQQSAMEASATPGYGRFKEMRGPRILAGGRSF